MEFRDMRDRIYKYFWSSRFGSQESEITLRAQPIRWI